jgi:hypothetical protein
MQFEYAYVGASENDRLEELGKGGWEMVSVDGGTAYLKRRVPTSPTTLAKVCSNCNCFEECVSKDADGQAFGECSEWKLAVAAGGSCDQFTEKAYGQASGQAAPYRPAEGRPFGQEAGPVAVEDTGRQGISAPPDEDRAWHWKPRTERGEKRLETTTSQDSGIDSPSHKHKVVVILDKNGKVVRGKTDMVNGHDHPISINGIADEADGHTHTFDPTPQE